MRMSGGQQLSQKPQQHVAGMAQPCHAVRRVQAAAAAEVAQPTPQVVPPQRGPLNTAEFNELMKAFACGISKSQYKEHAYTITPEMVEGTIPRELCRTLLRNGPAVFEIGDKKIAQPFDGDGMVCSIAFKDGQVYFRNKLVRTEGLIAEQRAGRPLFRSAFNKGKPDGVLFNNPLDLSIKDVANTHVVHWGGKTLALYERGRPHRLDAQLNTLGIDTLKGAMGSTPWFAAHHRIMPDQGKGKGSVMVAFGATEKGKDADITVWEFDEQFNQLSKIEDIRIPGGAFGFYHDMAVTDNYYVFIENPVRINLWKVLTQYTTGAQCIAGCLDFQRQLQVKVHLIPRAGAAAGTERKCITVDGPPFFTFHFANAWELNASSCSSKGSAATPATPAHSSAAPAASPASTSGRIAPASTHLVVETNSAPYVDLGFTAVSSPKGLGGYYDSTDNMFTFGRIVVDLQKGTAVRHSAGRLSCDLPTVSPRMVGRPSQHTYLSGAITGAQFLPPQAIVKYSMPPDMGAAQAWDHSKARREWWAPESFTSIAQEPVFVPRPGAASGSPADEDDGWILSMVLDTKAMRSQIVVLDAKHVSQGPVATITLPHHIPLGLHGNWTPSVLGFSKQDDIPHATPFDIRGKL